MAEDSEQSVEDTTGGFQVARRHVLAGGLAAGLSVGAWLWLDEDEDVEGTGYGDAIDFEPSYELSLTMERADGETVRLQGRFVDDDHYLSYEWAPSGLESYRIGGDQYFVVDGACQAYRELDADRSPPQTVTRDTADEPPVTVERSGSTTIDGTEVDIYSLPPTTTAGATSPTYYVDTETRYLRRLERDSSVVDYSAWGTAAPITAPDLDCQTRS